MPLAQESIIATGAVNSRAPLKKSTVAAIGLGILALAALGVVAPVMLGSSEPKPVAKPVEKEAPPQVGRPQTIDNEFEEAQRRDARMRAEAERQAAAVAAARERAPVPMTSPVPENVRRGDSSAAVYANQSSSPKDGKSKEDVEFEIDSAGRTSKSIAFDQGGTSVASMTSGADDALRNLMPTAEPTGRSSGPAAPSNNSALDAFLKTQGTKPSGAPRIADKEWLKEMAAEKMGEGGKKLRPYQVKSPYTLIQGKVMPAVLMRDINTDLPGELSACLTLDVYDSLSSDHLLMPKGTCLVGQYSSAVRPGQDRVLFAFNRIILPNGLSFDLPAATGSDIGGASGIKGEVNNHFFRMFSSSFLVAWLADRAERNKSSSMGAGSSGGPQSAAGQVLVDTSRTILERDKLIAPTITVGKGERINVEVTQDMEFPGPYRK